MCTPWYVYPRTHITSDMCTPGRDTQNSEALNPGLQTWRRRGTDFVGLYFEVSTNPKLKRCSIYVLLSTADGIIRCIWERDLSSIYFWQVSSQTTALTGQGYQYYYDHRSVICVSQRIQNVCLPRRLCQCYFEIFYWFEIALGYCRQAGIQISQTITGDMIYQTISGDAHITGQRSQRYLSSINLESIIYLLAIYKRSYYFAGQTTAFVLTREYIYHWLRLPWYAYVHSVSGPRYIGDTHITERRSQWYVYPLANSLSSVNLESTIHLLATYKLS